jgi:predicted dehydrogenase
VKANVKHISASGVTIVSTTPDIANARIEFDNGCVANLTASRISLKQMRKMRLFQHDAYISIDFLKKQSQVFRLYDYTGEDVTDGYVIDPGGEFGQKVIRFENPEIQPINAIKMELELFYKSIVEDTEPPVTVMDGFRALQIAHRILDQVEKTTFVH